MGYTHYWRRVGTLRPESFDRWRADVRRMLANLPETTETAGGYYASQPLGVRIEEDTPHLLTFNGIGELSHRELWIDQERRAANAADYPDDAGRWFGSCETARKPYDLAVCAALILAVHHFGERRFQVSSDGGPEDWTPALELVRGLFGFGELPAEIRAEGSAA